MSPSLADDIAAVLTFADSQRFRVGEITILNFMTRDAGALKGIVG